MNQGSGHVNFDSRVYDIQPWNGIPSEWFVRCFLPDVEGWLHTHGDDYHSYHEHVVTRDDFDGLNEPRGLRNGMNANMIKKQEQAFKVRARKTFAFLRLHVLDITIKKEFDARRCEA